MSEVLGATYLQHRALIPVEMQILQQDVEQGGRKKPVFKSPIEILPLVILQWLFRFSERFFLLYKMGTISNFPTP